MQIKAKFNFSFSQLSSRLDNIIDNALNNTAKSSSNKTKSNISTSKDISGAALEPLSKTTLTQRQLGQFWEGDGQGVKGEFFKPTILKNLTKTSNKTPLKYSGNLLNSIKAKKNTMTMAGYGGLHHEGYKVNGNVHSWTVPSRPFIQAEIDNKTIDLFVKDIYKNLGK